MCLLFVVFIHMYKCALFAQYSRMCIELCFYLFIFNFGVFALGIFIITRK